MASERAPAAQVPCAAASEAVVGAIAALATAVDQVLERYDRDGVVDEAAAVEALSPAMADFLARAGELPDDARRPNDDGGAVGHLLYADPDERFHIISVVFPPGTTSGAHEHGCWGVIGYVAGLDEETRYQRVDGGDSDEGCVLEEVERVVHEPGTISRLLPPDEMHHRVRNPGDEDGISVHVLCRLPESHPHKYYDREHHRLVPYPFRSLPGGRVLAEVEFPS